MLDIYFLPEYGRLCETMEEGKCEVFEYKSENGRIDNMYIKRPVPWIINGEQYYDIVTPYGYGGPIILESSNRETLKHEYSRAFQKHCEKEKIVSEFIRFHPIFQNYQDVDDTFEVIYSRHTVGTNLRDFDDPIQKEFAKSLRRNNRRAVEKGVTVTLHPSPESLSVFRKLYEETMDRNHADTMYYFPDKYYEVLEFALKPYILEIQLHYKSEIIASEIYFTAGDILHAHLLGSNEKMLELEAGGLLEAAAANWGKEHGYRYIHHGGGRSNNPDDALFCYKKKFGKNTEFDFYIGRKIWNQDIYDTLVKMRVAQGAIDDDAFFPKYRA